MKILNTVAAVIFMAAAACPAAATNVDPMSQAVIDAYTDILKEQPSDYTTMYQRAMQYFQMGFNKAALADVQKAINLTPDKNKELKASEYELLASLMAVEKDYAGAVTGIRNALKYSPDNYKLLYRLGEFSLLANDLAGAKVAFLAMQRQQSLSAEAMIGLARIDIANNNIDDAMTKLKLANEYGSTKWTVSNSIGNLMKQLNQPSQAALYYIKAIALADGQQQPLRALFDLAETNYSDVVATVKETGEKANNATMSLLLANLAFENGHYAEAMSALNKVLEYEQGKQPGVYNLLAECQFAMADFDNAMANALRASSMSTQPKFLRTLADVQHEKGLKDEAMTTVDRVLEAAPEDVETLIKKAGFQAAAGNYQQACELLQKALDNEPDNIYLLTLAGLMQEKAGMKEAANSFAHAAQMDAVADIELACKAIAQMKSGKTLDADGTLRKLSTINTPGALYWAAVACASNGDADKSRHLANDARMQGFENRYLLDYAKGPMTLRP